MLGIVRVTNGSPGPTGQRRMSVTLDKFNEEELISFDHIDKMVKYLLENNSERVDPITRDARYLLAMRQANMIAALTRRSVGNAVLLGDEKYFMYENVFTESQVNETFPHKKVVESLGPDQVIIYYHNNDDNKFDGLFYEKNNRYYLHPDYEKYYKILG